MLKYRMTRCRIPQNQPKIDQLTNELARAERHGDAFGIRFLKADLLAAKSRDKAGQMA
jgi:hypothetical protein